MNNLNWIQHIQWQDVIRPYETLEKEKLYTLYMKDFLRMPDIDYFELAEFDPHVRILLN